MKDSMCILVSCAAIYNLWMHKKTEETCFFRKSIGVDLREAYKILSFAGIGVLWKTTCVDSGLLA